MNPAFFFHDFVWVNDGNWQQNPPEQKAINSARVAADRIGINTYNADVLIRRLRCNANHIDVCQHLVVSFHEGACSDSD